MGKFVKKQSLQCRVGILKTRSLQYMEKLVKKQSSTQRGNLKNAKSSLGQLFFSARKTTKSCRFFGAYLY